MRFVNERTQKIFQNSTGGRTMGSRQVHMNEHRAIGELGHPIACVDFPQ